MILLTDIILESKASEEAKQLGLEKKPGVGLYGPPNSPATHRSWLGKLKPLADKKSSSTKDSLIKKVSGFFGNRNKPTTPDTPKVTYPQFTHPTSKSSLTADSLRKTFTESGAIKNINDTLNALTQAYGRDTAPQVLPPGRGMGISGAAMDYEVNAVYNYMDDTVEISDKYRTLTDKPMTEWDRVDVYSFNVHIHETLHSTSPRVRGSQETGKYFYDTAINVAIEEGMTEYLTHSITTDLLKNPELSYNASYGYKEYVDAIKVMADHGNLDVDAAFKDGSVNEVSGEWNIRTQSYNAQYYAIQNIMTGAGYSQEDVYEIFDIVKTQWSMDKMSLTTPSFVQSLQKMASGNEVSLDELRNSL